MHKKCNIELEKNLIKGENTKKLLRITLSAFL
jgi:hypothetical protein